jgi:hypothetical protein
MNNWISLHAPYEIRNNVYVPFSNMPAYLPQSAYMYGVCYAYRRVYTCMYICTRIERERERTCTYLSVLSWGMILCTFLCMYMCTHAHVYPIYHACAHTLVYTHTQICTPSNVHMQTCTQTHTDIQKPYNVHIHTCKHTHIHAHTCLEVLLCIFFCIILNSSLIWAARLASNAISSLACICTYVNVSVIRGFACHAYACLYIIVCQIWVYLWFCFTFGNVISSLACICVCEEVSVLSVMHVCSSGSIIWKVWMLESTCASL